MYGKIDHSLGPYFRISRSENNTVKKGLKQNQEFKEFSDQALVLCIFEQKVKFLRGFEFKWIVVFYKYSRSSRSLLP